MDINILSFSDAKRNGRMSYDDKSDTFTWHTASGDFLFLPKDDLYVWNASSLSTNNILPLPTDLPKSVATLASVAENQQLFTKKAVGGAQAAREFLRRLGYPAPARIADMIRHGHVLPVTTKDLMIADEIYGKPAPMLQGKTVEKKVKFSQYNPIPTSLISSTVEIQCDIFFMYGLAFLLSVSIPLHLTVVSKLKGADRGAPNLFLALKSHISVYTKRGFIITKVISDKEGGIAKAGQHISQIHFESRSTHAHVIENKIKYVKGNARALIYSLKFKLARQLLQWVVSYAVYAANLIPSEGGLPGISPREAIYGKKIDFEKALPCGFGDYCHVKYKTDQPDNTMRPRTFGAIALLPTGNDEGAVKFLNLATGHVVTASQFVVLPTPDEIIHFMNYVADKYPYDEKTESDDAALDDGALEDLEKLWKGLISHDLEVFPAEIRAGVGVEPHPDEENQEISRENEKEEEKVEVEHDTRTSDTSSTLLPTGVDQTAAYTAQPPVPTNPAVGVDVPPTGPGPPVRYNLRPSRIPTYKQTKAVRIMPVTVGLNDHEEDHDLGMIKRVFYNDVGYFTFILSTMSVRDALIKFPVEAQESIALEMSQMLSKQVFHPVDTTSWSREDMKNVIPSMMFLKEKFLPSGLFEKLKSRLVAGGHRQNRLIYDSKDISSPTASMFAIFSLACIWARERRKVVAFDITGAYLNAEIRKNKIFMRIGKEVAKVLCSLDRKYEDFLQKDGSVIVQLDKALYGLVESAKLWYDDIADALVSIGFERNPVEKCVFNKLNENGIQCTVVLYVDDSAVASTDEKMIDEVRNLFKSKYKDVGERGGSIIPFLGMLFDYSIDGEVSISMPKYVDDYLTKYPNSGFAKTPATENLFLQRDNISKLSSEKKENFHSEVATLLYLSHRIRGDIMLPVAYLTTRVNEPDEDDLAKLLRLRNYIAATKEQKLTLKTDDFVFRVYVDSSFGVHPNGRSHSGMVISLGRGSILCKSSKQKINTKSSAEAELIAVSDLAGWCIHCEEFIKYQGYSDRNVLLCQPERSTILYQDNQSTIKLLTNGRDSSGDGTRHIRLRDYWVKDYVDRGELRVEYIATADMRADILTKALQGSLFQRQRAMLLGQLN